MHIVLLGIDGLRPDLVTPETMPTLWGLATRGVWAESHRTVFPSETRGALTALVSGARPETTGVLGNEFFAFGANTQLTGTNTIHQWRAAEASLPDGMVTSSGLSAALAAAGLPMAVVTSSGQGSFTALSWGGERRGTVGYNVRHPAIGYPAPLAAAIEAAHCIPPTGMTAGGEAAVVAAFTRTVWPAHRPALAILWVTEVDGASHRYGVGAPDMLASMKACDEALAGLLHWRNSQPECDDIAIMVTSDHGHSTIGGLFSTAAVLRDSRLDPVGAVMRRGRIPALWWPVAPDQALLADMVAALAERPEVGAIFTRPEEPGSAHGCVAGTLSVALTGVGHARAPHLLVHLAGTADLNGHGHPGVTICDADGYFGTPLAGGTHGGMAPSELGAVFAAEGPGIASGRRLTAPTGIQDIAPTILAMLGARGPSSMTGRVLHEVLGAADPETASERFEARHGGRASLLRLRRVAGRPYLDAAEHALDGIHEDPPRRRDDLVVPRVA